MSEMRWRDLNSSRASCAVAPSRQEKRRTSSRLGGQTHVAGITRERNGGRRYSANLKSTGVMLPLVDETRIAYKEGWKTRTRKEGTTTRGAEGQAEGSL